MGGAASSVSRLPNEGATAAQIKGVVGCLYDESKFGDGLTKAKLIEIGNELGISDTSQIVIANLCQFAKCRVSLDAAWDQYKADNGGDNAGLSDIKSFDHPWVKWDTRECDPKLVQHIYKIGGSDEPVTNVEELYEAAKKAHEIFVAKLQEVLERAGNLPNVVCDGHDAGSGNLMVAPLKGVDRIEAKVESYFKKTWPASKYSVVHDVVRGTYIADSVKDAADLVQWLKEHGEQAGVQLVRVENRFAPPKVKVTGYRDANLSLQITLDDRTKHVCELQVHLREIKQQSEKLKSHETYELFRQMFDGNGKAVDERLGVRPPSHPKTALSLVVD